MAGDRLHAPVELARFAGTVLDVGDQLTGAAGSSVRDLALPGTAFGTTPGGIGLHRMYSEAVDTAVSLGSKLSEVLEGDADRLYRSAFAFHKADQDTQRRMNPPVNR
jgi:hypothetical protein